MPASASFRNPIICSSLNRFFMVRSSSRIGLYYVMKLIAGADHTNKTINCSC
jgi:hypothetical protein